jgi:hypothetical protein
MDPEIKAPKLRIVSDKPEVVARALNVLLDDYAAITWNFAVVKDELTITVVMVHQSEIRKMQLMMGGAGPGPRFS